MKKYWLLLLGILLLGCARPYEEFYQDNAHLEGLDKYMEALTTEPQLMRGNDKIPDGFKMIANGYLLVGESAFMGKKFNENQAVEQAKKVNASLVLVYSKYVDTLSGLAPLTLPDVQTSTTYFTGNVVGASGFARVYGSEQTTNYGSRTIYMPYNIDRYEQYATYWAKRKSPPIFGAWCVDVEMPPELRGHKFLKVFAVVKGSPADHAGIMADDMLEDFCGPDAIARWEKIGEKKYIIDFTKFTEFDVSDLNSFLRQNAGKTVAIRVMSSDGKESLHEVALNNFPDSTN